MPPTARDSDNPLDSSATEIVSLQYCGRVLALVWVDEGGEEISLRERRAGI